MAIGAHCLVFMTWTRQHGQNWTIRVEESYNFELILVIANQKLPRGSRFFCEAGLRNPNLHESLRTQSADLKKTCTKAKALNLKLKFKVCAPMAIA